MMNWLFVIWVGLLTMDARLSFLKPSFEGKIRVVDFVFILFLGVWLKKHIMDRKALSKPPLWGAIAGLWAAAALSLLAAGNVRVGVVQWIGFGYLLAIYAVMSDVFREASWRKKFIDLWVTVNVALSILAIGSCILAKLKVPLPLVSYYATYPNLQFFPRVHGLSNNPNSFAFDLHFAALFALANWMQLKKSGLPAGKSLAAFLIILLAQFLCLSRLVAGTLAAAWICFAWVHVKDAWFYRFRRMLKAGSLVMLPLIMVITIWTIMPVRLQLVRNGADLRLHLIWNRTPNMYLQLGEAGLEMFRDHPALGVGLCNYTDHLKDYMPKYEADPYNVYSTPHTRIRFVPHHVLIGWISETGLVGLAAMLLFLGLYFRRLWQIAAQDPEPERVVYWAAAVGFLIQSFLCNFLYTRIFWIFIALSLSLWKRESAGRGQLQQEAAPADL